MLPHPVYRHPAHNHYPYIYHPHHMLLQQQENNKNLNVRKENKIALKSRWTFPGVNMLKLNTDGSSKGNPGPSSFGGLIRDAVMRLGWKEADNDHPLKSIMDDITKMMKEQKFVMLHRRRDGNQCADHMARLVIFRSAVINAGYRISGTHVNPLGLKSNALMEVIWDIMRCWV
uniref:Probable tRNA (Guanine(26)-N(2))-dimethyltransferase 2 n=1 Tax=Tanacetum cinerariifolium TaxID=118510 RepID=A0A6L2MV54_TANCI|nr:probable tRNA (guanine(26)-N(2))-dimethyltransferase 2 [Tanacetum cinerariifolium]